MDPSTLIGLLLAFGAVLAMVTLEGAHVQSLLLPPPMILVFGATLAVGFASGKARDAVHAFGSLPKAFLGRTPKGRPAIAQLVEIADTARREGLLSLERFAEEAKDPFLKKALQNIADGTDGEELRELLEEDIHTSSKADKAASKYFKIMGGYAPTIGIIGTVVSLTHVLENLDDPASLGHSIAAAFVATLWGLLSANFLWLPFGDRLARLATAEEEYKTLVMEGILAIQVGTPGRLVEERLLAMLPPKERGKPKKAAAGDDRAPGKHEK